MARSQRGTAPKGGAPPNCFTCQWRQRSEWCVLAADDVEVLNSSKVTHNFEPGQYVYLQGDECKGVYSILSGSVAVRKSDRQGHTVLVRMRNEGESLGYRDFFAGSDFTTSADALEGRQNGENHGGSSRRPLAIHEDPSHGRPDGFTVGDDRGLRGILEKSVPE